MDEIVTPAGCVRCTADMIIDTEAYTNNSFFSSFFVNRVRSGWDIMWRDTTGNTLARDIISHNNFMHKHWYLKFLLELGAPLNVSDIQWAIETYPQQSLSSILLPMLCRLIEKHAVTEREETPVMVLLQNPSVFTYSNLDKLLRVKYHFRADWVDQCNYTDTDNNSVLTTIVQYYAGLQRVQSDLAAEYVLSSARTVENVLYHVVTAENVNYLVTTASGGCENIIHSVLKNSAIPSGVVKTIIQAGFTLFDMLDEDGNTILETARKCGRNATALYIERKQHDAQEVGCDSGERFISCR